MRGLVNGGLPLGSLFGIPIRVHWSFLALLLILMPRMNGSTLLLLEALVLTVLIHEFGHCFAARSVGGEAKGILLWPLGGLAFIAGGDDHPFKKFWVILAGPLTHLPLAGLCAAALASAGHPLGMADLNPMAGFQFPDGGWVEVVYAIFRMQILLFCFNLCLPAYPMDGGQILVAMLSTFLPLETTVLLIACSTGGVAYWLFSQGIVLIAAWLAYEAFNLFAAAFSPSIEYHPIGRLYTARTRVLEMETGGVYIAPGLELIPCPECGKELHPRSQQCVHCEAKFDKA